MATEFSNIDFGFRYGTQAAIENTTYRNGTFNIATNTGELYIDIGGSRISMNKDIHLVETEVELRSILEPTSDRIYYTKDTCKIYVYSDQLLKWVNIGGSPDEINARIDNLVGVVNSLHSFEIIVLEPGDDLPEEGQSNIIYFVPQDETEDEDTKYDEYIWVANEEYYEKIGITEADLGNYYKKSEVDAIIGSNYVTDPTDINFKGLVADRLTTNENNIGELKAEIGNLDSTSTEYITVADRLTELEAKMGSSMDPSSTTGFVSVDARLDTLESASSTGSDDISELENKFGSYKDSDATGFVDVESRFTEIEFKLGSTMDPSSTTGFVSVDGRLDTLESKASTDESDIDELEAKFGTYKSSNATGFVSVESRFTELEAKMGTSMGSSTSTGFVSVDGRLDELEAKVGSTMDSSSTTGFQSIDQRLSTLETTGALGSDVAEIMNQIGQYPHSTDPGFESIYNKLLMLEYRIACLEAAALSVANPDYVLEPYLPGSEPDPEPIPDESDPEEPEENPEENSGDGE